jgi:flagellar basal-body rod protein FlgF
MDALSIAAASGLRSRMETLDMLANNLANSTTGGFKLDREFYSLYVSSEAQASSPDPTTVPVIEKQWTDFSQGLLVNTGNNLDVALSGNGSFRLSPAGVLMTAEGYPLVTPEGKKIQAPSSSALEITPDGEVLQDGQSLGKLHLVDFPENTAIVKQGNNYFHLADSRIKATPVTTARVEQGKIENSNVSPAETAVRLVSVMRQFEMLQKAVSLGSDMNRRAVEEVAKVGS